MQLKKAIMLCTFPTNISNYASLEVIHNISLFTFTCVCFVLWFPAVNSEPCVTSLAKVGAGAVLGFWQTWPINYQYQTPYNIFYRTYIDINIKTCTPSKMSRWLPLVGPWCPLNCMWGAVAEAAVRMTSWLYINMIRWGRPRVSMTVCQAGPTGVIKQTHCRQICDFCSVMHLKTIIVDVHGNSERRKALPLNLLFRRQTVTGSNSASDMFIFCKMWK